MKKPFILLILAVLFLFSCDRKGDTDLMTAPPSVEENREKEHLQEMEILIDYLEGDVFLVSQEGSSLLDMGDLLKQGDHVRVGAESYCEIKFGDYSTVTVQENTAFDISMNILDGQNRQADLFLETGSILCKVQKLTGNDQFMVSTTTTVCGVRGTEFLVVTEEDGSELRIAVQEGAVSLTPVEMDWNTLKRDLEENHGDLSEYIEVLDQKFPLVEAGEELQVDTAQMVKLGSQLSESTGQLTAEAGDPERAGLLIEEISISLDNWSRENPPDDKPLSSDTRALMEQLTSRALSHAERSENAPVQIELQDNSDSSDKAMKFYSATDSRITSMGRHIIEDDAIKLNFVGGTFIFRFRGSTGLVVLMESLGNQDPEQYTDYALYLDGVRQAQLKIPEGEDSHFPELSMDDGEHEIRIIKNTWTSTDLFKGILLDEGAELLQAPQPQPLIEFVGATYATGFGNLLELSYDELSQSQGQYGFRIDNTDITQSWPILTADKLDCGYSIVATPGIGLLRSYENMDLKMDQIYNRDLPWDPSAEITDWGSRPHPDLMIINIGSDDYYIGLDVESGEFEAFRESFIKAYSGFLAEIRALHPSVPVITLYGVNLRNDWPEGLNAYTNFDEDIKRVMADREAEGDRNLYLLQLPQQTEPLGADYLPSVHTHQSTAESLVEMIRNKGLLDQ